MFFNSNSIGCGEKNVEEFSEFIVKLYGYSECFCKMKRSEIYQIKSEHFLDN